MARMISMIVVIGTLLRVMISGRVGPCMLYTAPKGLVNNSHKLWGPYTLYLLFRSFVRSGRYAYTLQAKASCLSGSIWRSGFRVWGVGMGIMKGVHSPLLLNHQKGSQQIFRV